MRASWDTGGNEKNVGASRRGTSFRNQLVKHLKSDRNILHTSMVDFYGMPKDGDRAWPGREEAAQMPHALKGEHVAQKMLADLRTVWDGGERFVPFVMMHEFEALLFSDCDAFARALEIPELAGPLRHIRDQFESPEHINHGRNTAPSKRITALHPSYGKVVDGTAAARAVTVDKMAEQCRHFAAWLQRLEALAMA